MEPSSFIIEFAEHLPHEKRKYHLDQLAHRGAKIEEEGAEVVRVTCTKAKELAAVGWVLFHTSSANYCTVVGTVGEAENRANAYRDPPKGN